MPQPWALESLTLCAYPHLFHTVPFNVNLTEMRWLLYPSIPSISYQLTEEKQAKYGGGKTHL